MTSSLLSVQLRVKPVSYVVCRTDCHDTKVTSPVRDKGLVATKVNDTRREMEILPSAQKYDLRLEIYSKQNLGTSLVVYY